MTASLPDKLARRPDLIREFRDLDDSLATALRSGAETGSIRRGYDALAAKTMRELGTTQRPTGADFARASLLSSARTLREDLSMALAGPAASESEAETVAPSRKVRMRV